MVSRMYLTRPGIDFSMFHLGTLKNANPHLYLAQTPATSPPLFSLLVPLLCSILDRIIRKLERHYFYPYILIQAAYESQVLYVAGTL